MPKPKLIATFPSVGRTHYASTHPHLALDLDLDNYLFEATAEGEISKNPARYIRMTGRGDYIKAILSALDEEKYRYILIDQDAHTIKYLIELGYHVTLVSFTNTDSNRMLFCGRAMDLNRSRVWLKDAMSRLNGNPKGEYTPEEQRSLSCLLS